jgi:tRNA-uridine 2-sulfurtransferase
MSGGVDSSVAAALLMEQGYEVVGVTLHLWDYPDDGSVKGRCCAPEDVHDARRVADQLGFPHYAFDRRELFEKSVVSPFVDAYLAGETPSPCVWCNRGVKVAELVDLADKLGAPKIATGHYARIRESGGENAELRLDLLCSEDRAKDQSYFLHMLPDSTLRRFVFPLGGFDKKTVRQKAVDLGLAGAQKGESQELCFVPTGRYDELVEKRAQDRIRPGNIIGPDGRIVGTHGGIHKFTRGQRRNLGVAVGQRAYVVEVDAETATVQLGEKDDLLVPEIYLADVALRSGVSVPCEADVVVRYQGSRTRARIVPQPGGGARVHFESPIVRPSRGQYAVFYEGERVLGGGVIVDERRASHADAHQ